MPAVARERIEFGDFQTPEVLARAICRALCQERPATIVEPSPDFGGTVDAEYPSGRRYRRAEGGAVVTAERTVGRRELRPRVLDNYFVSRGYAVLSAATLGTGDSQGCPTAIGTDEKIGMKTVIEWLTGQEVTVSWSTGN